MAFDVNFGYPFDVNFVKFLIFEKFQRIPQVLPSMTSNFGGVLEHFQSKIMKIQEYAPPPEPGPKNRFP